MVDEIRVRRRHYRTGDGALDAKIREIVAEAAAPGEADLLREMITTCHLS